VLVMALSAKILKVCILFSSISIATGCHSAEPSAVPADYKLVWAEEFDQEGAPDPRAWGYETWGNRSLWWHNERQLYTSGRSDNARVGNGVLTVEARKEALSALPGWVGQEYSSVRLSTVKKKSWKYGFFEVRAKLACGRGVWPAFWLLSETGKWPDDGEIDIMEQVGHEPGHVYSTLHSTFEANKVSGMAQVDNTCGAFHNYQMDWRADKITFLVDGKVTLSAEKGSKSYREWPFDHKFYLIINTAVGGAWGGQKGIDPTAFPSRMDVDYVRVYQQK
jgi:beta-glucanase (GH16 family)